MKKVAISIFFLVSISCQQTHKSTAEDVLGRWQVDRAMRDGEITETLSEAFFHFKPDGTLTSNLNRSEVDYQYDFSNDIISQTGPLEVEYSVLTLQKDTMILGAVIRNYDFKFLLVRDTIVHENTIDVLEL